MFSDSKGFLLADGLIALVIVSISVLIVTALIQMKSSSQQSIREAFAEQEDEYEHKISEIDACLIECREDTESPE